MTKNTLNDFIIEGIQKTKGKEIVNIDLSKIDNRICQNYIICHGDSNTQVGAIADSIQEEVSLQLSVNAFHKEGLRNREWVLLDYIETIVHIFQKPTRDYFKVEELWADADITYVKSDY